MLGLENPLHLALLLLVLLLVFGAKRLPDLGRSLGSGLRGFKESVSGEKVATPEEDLTPAGAIPEQSAADGRMATAGPNPARSNAERAARRGGSPAA